MAIERHWELNANRHLARSVTCEEWELNANRHLARSVICEAVICEILLEVNMFFLQNRENVNQNQTFSKKFAEFLLFLRSYRKFLLKAVYFHFHPNFSDYLQKKSL